MAHFGILCPASIGHLNSMCALGLALRGRGHRVTLVQIPMAEPFARAAGLEFHPIGASLYTPELLASYYAKLGRLKGFAALRWTMEIMKRRAEMVLREAPDAVRSAKIDGLIVDQVSLEGGTVAESAGIPHVSIANALPLNIEPGVPPISSHRGFRDSATARIRNRAAYFVQNQAFGPYRRAVRDGRRAAGLPALSGRDPWFSNLVQVGQIPVEFDFPRRDIPAWFHYTGPFHAREARAPVAFPSERLDGRPLIYASMGTLQNRLLHVFEAIAKACAGLDAQLVISLGGSAAPESLPPLPGSPIVVGYAPQLDLVARASLVITHAGLNTTMETLGQGVPMVAIPVANDQPGVASRLAHAGAGLVVPLPGLNHERLRRAIERVMSEPGFAENAKRLQAAILRAGGAERASRVIEQALTTGQPVLAGR